MLRFLTSRARHRLLLLCLTLAVILPGLAGLPVIDRDEARFAQASVQMAESNDILNIRFQDEARNKKPAAAYWAQTAMIKIFSRDSERRIWAQRLPSLLASLVSILALYWGGARMVGRDAAFIAAALLAVSTIFVFEGHIAKTDALLCASTTVMFACLGRLRFGAGQAAVWGFWIALGLSIMIKGTIGLILGAASLASLWIWERELSWARPLLNWKAILIFVLIWLPWGIAMYHITDGAFFAESLGNDLGGKVTSGREGHGAPPGSHTLSIWATLWPASLFLLPGFAYAVMSARSRKASGLSRSMRLALCWALPFWILIEFMPTKLPHYGLPVFPAICLMIGASVIAMRRRGGFKKTRLIGGIGFLLGTGLMVGAMIYIQTQHGTSGQILAVTIICGVTMFAALFAFAAMWTGRFSKAFAAAVISAAVYFIGAYGLVLPNLPDFKTSERIYAALQTFAPDVPSAAIHSPHYREPSLVYHVGKDIDVTERPIKLSDGSLVIVNARREDAAKIGDDLRRSARRRGFCLQTSDPVDGFNYSKGAPLSLLILREGPC